MNAQKVYEEIYFHLKNNSQLNNLCDIAPEHPSNASSIEKGLLCVSLLQDYLTGKYECNDVLGLEIQCTFYHQSFSKINGRDNFEELTKSLVLNFQSQNTYLNLHLVKRLFPKFFAEVGMYQSVQIYRIYFQES